MAERDQDNVARLTRQLRSGPPPILVPHLEDDVHDIRGLIEMADGLGIRAAAEGCCGGPPR